MHLASDAVRAAAESPFLDGALETSAGVLCLLLFALLAFDSANLAGARLCDERVWRRLVL